MNGVGGTVANDQRSELVKSEERFRLLVESVKDYAIFMLDPNGIVTSWNEGAKHFKGYESFEIIGQHFSKFYTEKDIKRNHPAEELKIARTVGRYEEEGWRVRKDGTQFWANVVITRLLDASGTHIGFAKVTRDLTEKKHMEDALRRSHDDLEARVRLRTRELQEALDVRDEFLSIASHELKTPLTSLKLQLQIMERNITRKTKLDLEHLESSMKMSIRQVDTVTDFVENLLDISRIRTGRFSLSVGMVHLSEVTQSVIRQLSPQMTKAELQINLNLAEAVNGYWDQRRLEQVLINLLTNAIKYARASTLTVSTRQEEGMAYLTVEDTGPGIPADRLSKIFERFERAGAPQSIAGLGLGLFIVQKIVEAHKGKIEVQSTAGKGTRFNIELPLKAELSVSMFTEEGN